MNSNFNTLGRAHLKIARPEQMKVDASTMPGVIKAQYVHDADVQKATQNFINSVKEAILAMDSGYLNKVSDMDEIKSEGSAIHVGIALDEVEQGPEGGIAYDCEAKDDGGSMFSDSYDNIGYGTMGCEAKGPENTIEVFGVKSFSYSSDTLSVIYGPEVSVYFNNTEQDLATFNAQFGNSVRVTLVGDNIDVEMDLYFEREAKVKSMTYKNIFSSLAYISQGSLQVGPKHDFEIGITPNAQMAASTYGVNEPVQQSFDFMNSTNIWGQEISMPASTAVQLEQSNNSLVGYAGLVGTQTALSSKFNGESLMSRITEKPSTLSVQTAQLNKATVQEELCPCGCEDDGAMLNKPIDARNMNTFMMWQLALQS